ncbi:MULTISPECIES: HlyD family secretion protein [Hydrocarboniphaga]|jgi:membrane fusion protein|uniref:AprE-like beta-barrel domain-containing protein n=1 Tax=Hydrocarboniphaga effusa AP103 TaxID=1172194 RepID=I8T386_9GAMM|nr:MULTISPECIES: HlyD family efflux transporter periplasmic adaptor subunit [Hydrocarboniphaga]EIT68395.1 hypothetical protein WQQ_35900 [Hydrocarboniphaga effusa AP103]MDZ4078617.1 HlyD family efflux transporter periplasmic adaptor subunit [Hydrocarboniphaga sp.]
MALYRKAALEAQAANPYGKVLLTQPASMLFPTLCCVVFAAALIAFLAFGSFTRHQTARGHLEPASGLAKVFSPHAGLVVEQRVQEGQSVAKGDVLFVVSSDYAPGTNGFKPPRNGTDYSVSKVAELRGQRVLLDEQIASQRARLSLSRQSVDTYRDLLRKHYVSAEQLQAKQADLLEQEGRLKALDRERLALSRALAEQFVSITATQSGTVTALSVANGQHVDPARPLLSIVPQDSPLQVSLYAPSRAVGFVAAGDGVLLRFDAYPYQKFGQYGGVVSWVSRTALSPREIGALGVSPESVEPLYEIRVQPDAQTVRAYGATHPLQPGMAVEADIRIERRRLYEWILDPLYALTRST